MSPWHSRCKSPAKKGALTISQANYTYTKSVLETYGMQEYKLVYTIRVGPEISIDQRERNLRTPREYSPESVHLLKCHVPGSSKPLRHSPWGETTVEGNLEPMECIYGDSQPSTPLPRRQHRFHISTPPISKGAPS